VIARNQEHSVFCAKISSIVPRAAARMEVFVNPLMALRFAHAKSPFRASTAAKLETASWTRIVLEVLPATRQLGHAFAMTVFLGGSYARMIPTAMALVATTVASALEGVIANASYLTPVACVSSSCTTTPIRRGSSELYYTPTGQGPESRRQSFGKER
jgi:hypothetical protein